MNQQELKEVLMDLYASKDDLWPALKVPSDYQGQWCVTDAHIALLVPHEIIGPANESPLDFSIIERNYVHGAPFSIKIAELSKMLSEAEKEPEYAGKFAACPECDGEGITSCPCCDNETDCKTCDGEGEIEVSREATGVLKFFDETYIKINDTYFAPGLLDRVIKGAMILKPRSTFLTCKYYGLEKQHLFEIDGVKWAVMPKRVANPDLITVIGEPEIIKAAVN